MKTICVTGANGFVGKHLVNELVECGYFVIAVGGSSQSKNERHSVVHQINLDLTKTKNVEKLDLSNVDAVIHLAGLASIGPSFDDPIGYIHTNAALEINIFERAIRQNVRPRFIIISSGSLYSSSAELPITEQSQIIPNSPYAVSKITQEQVGHYYGGRGFEVIVARPFNHIGPGQGTGFLVSDLASQIIACERKETSKIMVGNLEAKRDYTDVRDIARAYRLLLEKGKPNETYNICTGVSRSGHEILNSLLLKSTIQPQIEQDPNKMRPSDTPDIYGTHSKVTMHTGWKPSYSLDNTIQDVLEYWRTKK